MNRRIVNEHITTTSYTKKKSQSDTSITMTGAFLGEIMCYKLLFLLKNLCVLVWYRFVGHMTIECKATLMPWDMPA